MKTTIVVLLEIPSQNVTDRMHWRKRWKLKAQWQLRIQSAIGGRAIAGEVRRSVKITAYRMRKITDHANLVGGAKLVIDAIVSAGLIFDDSDKWCEIEYSQSSAKSSPTGSSCTIIEVDDII